MSADVTEFERLMALAEDSQHKADTDEQPKGDPYPGDTMRAVAAAVTTSEAEPAQPSVSDLPEDMQAALKKKLEELESEKKKPKQEPAEPIAGTQPVGGEPIIADVSSWDDDQARREVHKIGQLVQTGHRRLIDGSSTAGLGITECGIEQASRSHGWFYVKTDAQQKLIDAGEYGICPKCFPPYTTNE